MNTLKSFGRIPMEKDLQGRPSKVRIADIDLNPGPFCMSFQFDLEMLKASIERFGLLNPPYLVKNLPFTVVAGYRRLLAMRELGWTDIACRILPGDLLPLDALLFNLYDNLTARRFNPIEKGMALERLTRYLTNEEIVHNYMPMLELPSNMHTLKQYLSLEDLDDVIKASVAAGRLSMKVIELIHTLSKEDQWEINQLFTSLKWSVNLQWQAALWIMEIAGREGRSARGVIRDERIAAMAENDKMNSPQKVRAIVRELKEWRFPSIVESERSFKKAVSDLHLPSKVRVIPPAFFEGVDYKLEIVFREGKELREKLETLSRADGLEQIALFWKADNRG
jgi:ParB-like chromosome segregation protein Spo0J